jgi:hypothetical protein
MRRLPLARQAALRRATALLLAAATAGCERVVDLDLEPGPRRLVIEARVEAVRGAPSGRQTVRLTTTDAFAAAGPLPAARGARVEVADDQGGNTVFTESATQPGVYRTEALVAVAGRRYTLRIDFEGDRYEATEVLTPVPPIDSLYFRYEEANIAVGESGFRAAIDYRDPPGRRNFYLWEQLVDGRPQIVPDPGNRFRVISSDDFYDGARITGYQPYDESVIAPGQEVVVRQLGLSEAAYRFYFALFEQATGSQGSPFAVPPASARGNVANRTAPARHPLGYFLAAEVAEARATLRGDEPRTGPAATVAGRLPSR